MSKLSAHPGIVVGVDGSPASKPESVDARSLVIGV
jgi:hypothetical protein